MLLSLKFVTLGWVAHPGSRVLSIGSLDIGLGRFMERLLSFFGLDSMVDALLLNRLNAAPRLPDLDAVQRSWRASACLPDHPGMEARYVFR